MSGAAAQRGRGAGDGPAPDALAPLRAPVFRAIFVATAVSNLGTWMQEVGRATLMIGLTEAALPVALLQSAAMAALVLVVLPAGILADLADRRRMILVGHLWLIAVSAALAALALSDAATPALILALTFAGAAGAAFVGPPGTAVLPQIVGEKHLAQAMVLNGISFNLARAVGPALGGVVVAVSGPPAVFLLNALSFGTVLAVFARWRPPAAPTSVVPPERPAQALRAGLRYARHAPALRDTLLRVLAFALPASALWALLPILAGTGGNALDYGLLLGLVGLGSAITGFLLPRLRAALSAGALLTLAGGVLGLSMVASVWQPLRHVAMVPAGFGWMVTLALLMAGAQTAVPAWVRGRAAALFLLALGLGLAGGSAAWGLLAREAGIMVALAVAGLSQIAVALASRGLTAPEAAPDSAIVVEPRWPAPQILSGAAVSGPVRITVVYRVRPEAESAFLALMQQIGATRLASGSIDWDLFRHGADPAQWMETNLVSSWDDHLRQRQRQTAASQALEDALRAHLQPGSAPEVTHWLSAPGKFGQH